MLYIEKTLNLIITSVIDIDLRPGLPQLIDWPMFGVKGVGRRRLVHCVKYLNFKYVLPI